MESSKDQASDIKPVDELKFTKHSQNGWDFYHSVYPMSSSKQLDQISDQVGTMGLPEVFYGQNHFYIVNTAAGFMFDFCPVKAIALTGFTRRFQYDRNAKDVEAVEQALKQLNQEQMAERNLNLVDMSPKKVQVKESSFWKNKDMSKVKDFKQIQITSDWTFQTPYKGTLQYLTNDVVDKIKNYTNLNLLAEAAVNESCKFDNLVVEDTQEQIPYQRLGPENPILHAGEIYMYECDLEDCGYICTQTRFRVMKDCFYVLLRSYLRVDGVIVRSLDTRIFGDFDSNYMLREFQHKEATIDELRMKGFIPDSEWMLSKTQADEVNQFLTCKLKTQDKITFA